MVGSLVNAASSVLLTMFVTRTLSDGIKSDIFSLAYSTALMLTTIGIFEVRQFQSTDVNNQFEFSDYLFMRYITCFIMIISGIFLILFKGYDFYKSCIIIIVNFYMMIGALQDVYHGLFQLKNRLDLAGKSLTLRITASIITFAVFIFFTSDLIISCISLCLVSITCFILFDLNYAKKLEPQHTKFRIIPKKQKELFIACFPLFICSFLSMYVLNAPKFAIDTFFATEGGIQTSYGILMMPAAVINLFSIFVFRPVMTPMANSFSTGNTKQFFKTLVKLIIYILISTIICLLIGYYLGIPVLSNLYGIDLHSYKTSLLIILIGGSFSALLSVLQYVITIIRQQYKLLIGYIIASIFAYFISNFLVQANGILGGAISYMLVYLFLLAYFIVLISYYIRKLNVKNLEGDHIK